MLAQILLGIEGEGQRLPLQQEDILILLKTLVAQEEVHQIKKVLLQEEVFLQEQGHHLALQEVAPLILQEELVILQEKHPPEVPLRREEEIIKTLYN